MSEKEYNYCVGCAKLFKKKDMIEKNGLLYCISCFNSLFATCKSCGIVKCVSLMFEDPLSSGHEEYYCEECMKKSFFRCKYCGEWEIKAYEYTSPENESMCETCYDEMCVECSFCGELMFEDDAHSIGYDHYCDDCFYERFFVCRGCGEICDLDDLIEDDLCSSCFEENMLICSECGRRFKSNCFVDNLCRDCYIKINPPKVTQKDIDNMARIINLSLNMGG